MDKSQSSRAMATVVFVVEKLAKNQFSELLATAKASRLSVANQKSVFEEYRINLAVPSITNFDKLDVVEIAGNSPQAWSVDYDLVDCEHGVSDLTLQLTLVENQKPLMVFELDDIHVL